MKYLVGEYHDSYMANKCKDENGNFVFIDLMVNADIDVKDDNYDQFMKDLVGKTVEVEYLQPFVTIGYGVEVINNKESI